MKRRRDKFMQDMGRVHRARQSRRSQRENEHLLDEETSLWQVRRENFRDSLKFRSQEFSALGKGVGRGVSREAGKAGKGIPKLSNLASNSRKFLVTSIKALGRWVLNRFSRRTPELAANSPELWDTKGCRDGALATFSPSPHLELVLKKRGL